MEVKKVVWIITKKYRFYEIFTQAAAFSFKNIVFIPYLSMPIVISEQNLPDLVIIHDLPKEEWESLWLGMKQKGIDVYVISEKCTIPKGFPNKFCLRTPISLSELERIIGSLEEKEVLNL